MVGEWLGLEVGECVGEVDGEYVGLVEGDVEGDIEGLVDGDLVGLVEGDAVGDLVGEVVGDAVGDVVGDWVGEVDGDMEGLVDGDLVGEELGELVGLVDGDIVGEVDGLWDGLMVGEVDGLFDGDCDGEVVGAGVQSSRFVTGLFNGMRERICAESQIAARKTVVYLSQLSNKQWMWIPADPKSRLSLRASFLTRAIDFVNSFLALIDLNRLCSGWPSVNSKICVTGQFKAPVHICLVLPLCWLAACLSIGHRRSL